MTFTNGSFSLRQQGRRILNWLHSWTHQIYCYTWNNFLWKNPRNHLSKKYTLGKWDTKTTAERTVDIRHTHSELHPRHGDHRGRELTTTDFSLRSERFEPHTWQLYIYNLRNKAPKYLALKANRTCVHKTHKVTVCWETVLKGIASLSSQRPSQGPSTTSTNGKVPRVFVKHTYLLILKLWPEGQIPNVIPI